jgi:hypothetical protein
LAFSAAGCLTFVYRLFPSHFQASRTLILTGFSIAGALSGALEVIYFHKSKAHSSRALPKLSPFVQALLWIIPERNRDHIIGDLEEECRTYNKLFPRLWYSWQAITLVASYRWAALRRLVGLDAIRKFIRK